MREAQPEELINIFKNNLNYVLELSVLQEPILCVKPVYQFEHALIDGEKFCIIYSEADDPETIFISYNSTKFKKIISGYNVCKIIFHGENGDGELCESFYCMNKNTVRSYDNFRLLTAKDKKFTELHSQDDSLNILFKDFIEDKIWRDCGIIGAFDIYNHFTGYLAYYELAENIRDISYIYIKKDFRRLGYAKELLNYFKNMNIQNNKISYYSYATDEVSANLAKSCGFLPCAKRYELEIN